MCGLSMWGKLTLLSLRSTLSRRAPTWTWSGTSSTRSSGYCRLLSRCFAASLLISKVSTPSPMSWPSGWQGRIPLRCRTMLDRLDHCSGVQPAFRAGVHSLLPERYLVGVPKSLQENLSRPMPIKLACPERVSACVAAFGFHQNDPAALSLDVVIGLRACCGPSP